ncbi:MAG: hypothetical protein VYC88_03795 [SAR324 cluster bacterium]|nr:hypothetical protein [SAR324 cluster bacterium]
MDPPMPQGAQNVRPSGFFLPLFLFYFVTLYVAQRGRPGAGSGTVRDAAATSGTRIDSQAVSLVIDSRVVSLVIDSNIPDFYRKNFQKNRKNPFFGLPGPK